MVFLVGDGSYQAVDMENTGRVKAATSRIKNI